MSITRYNDAATNLQRIFRGAQTRKKITIKSIGSGVIHTKIHGGEDTFDRVGINIDPIRDKNNKVVSRTLNILSADPQLYSISMVGGNKVFNPISSNNKSRKELIGNSSCNIFITGGNFNTLNSGKTFEGHPPYRPIGPTKTKQADVFIPTPEENKSDYAQIFGDDGSYISVAPALSKAGKSLFSKSKLNESKYNYETIRQGKAPMYPGLLYHASDPNPRAAYSAPESPPESSEDEPGTSTKANLISTAKQDRIRLAVVTSVQPRGSSNDGLRLDEMANVMARISQMDEHSGTSYNLDGGGSVVMGVTDQDGNLTFHRSQTPGGRAISTMLTVVQKSLHRTK